MRKGITHVVPFFLRIILFNPFRVDKIISKKLRDATLREQFDKHNVTLQGLRRPYDSDNCSVTFLTLKGLNLNTKNFTTDHYNHEGVE